MTSSIQEQIQLNPKIDNSPFLDCWSVYCVSVDVAEEHHRLIVFRGFKQPVFTSVAASKWRRGQRRKSGDV